MRCGMYEPGRTGKHEHPYYPLHHSWLGRHTPEDTTLFHRRTSCPCLCLQCTRAPVFLFFVFSFFSQKKKKTK